MVYYWAFAVNERQVESHLQIEGKVVAVFVGEFAEVFEADGIFEHMVIFADKTFIVGVSADEIEFFIESPFRLLRHCPAAYQQPRQ